MVGELGFEAALEKLDVDHFADDRGGDVRASVLQKVVLYLEGDPLSGGGVRSRLYNKRVAYPARVPGGTFLLSQRVDHKGKIGRFSLIFK